MSIYTKVCDNSKEYERLKSSGETVSDDTLRKLWILEDHGDIAPENRDAWIPGAFEAEVLRSDYDIRLKAISNFLIANAVKKQIKKPSPKHRAKMEKSLLKAYTISIADPVLSFLSIGHTDKEAMRAEALYLIKETGKRELVKFGIVLLGLCGKEQDKDLLIQIGSNDEFTLFSAGTLKMIMPQIMHNDIMHELSKKTFGGWGKVAAILEMTDDVSDEIKDSLLKSGAQCRIGRRYLAAECAIKGDMVARLEKECYNEIDAQIAFMNEYSEGLCNIFEGLYDAEKNNGDGFSVIDGIRDGAYAFMTLAKNCPSERTEDAVKKLEEIFGERKE